MKENVLHFSFNMKLFLLIVALIAAEAIILGFQHYLVMLGTTVIIPSMLVPLMGGGDVRSVLRKSSNSCLQFLLTQMLL